ncbi:MAG: hypothetical protein IT314_02485 [Anaerolineales bacterium]|nr:hypothetical protein [Anaerolineales bacterium]
MNLKKQDLYWILPLALALGFVTASLQNGNFLGFSFVFLLSLTLLAASTRWAGRESGRENPALTLVWIVALAFALRLVGGFATYAALPVYGHSDSFDGLAGYTYTDAHRRDDQAWRLATSGKPILDAFSGDYSSDQYGGLLALSAFVYRYLSPDAHRPLMMVLLSAFVAALGIPFLWKAARQTFGETVAWASAWIFALYPESILLGGSAMREPYLMTLSAIAFWGFISGVQELAPAKTDGKPSDSKTAARIALGLSLLGMLLFSPAVAVFTLIIFAGWMFFSRERANISWKAIAMFAVVFLIGLFALSSSLNRKGIFDTSSPMSVLNDWIQLSVKWNVYQIERESGWVQKLFDEMPEGLRLPFVVVYGILQPVLPATLVVPTVPIWKVIYVLRALGWYALLPLLILSLVTGSGPPVGMKREESRRSVFVWLSFLAWMWILLAALRGGGDQWDNPRYRTIMFMWQALIAGYVWVWWRETRNVWFARVVACEVVFILIFTQWYASRYFHVGGQLPFATMIALIVGLWAAILGGSWWLEKRRAAKLPR